MDPSTGEILALANWPTFNPNAFGKADDDVAAEPRHPNALRAGIDLQDRHRVRGARAEGHHAGVAGRDQPRAHHLPGPQADLRHAPLRHARLHRRDREVEQRRRDQGRAEGRAAASSTHYVNRFGFGQTLGPDFRGETAGHRVERRRGSNDSALASVSMGYQVGVTPLQMVDRGQLGRQRRPPARSRASCARSSRTAAASRCRARRCAARSSRDTAATMTTIMEQVVERGTARAAQIDGFTIAGKTGTAAKLVNGHYQKSDYNASFVGFIPSRKPALDDPRRHRFAARQGLHRRRGLGADLQAHRGSGGDLPRHRAEPERAAAGARRAARSARDGGRPRRSRRAPPACCRRRSSRRATG